MWNISLSFLNVRFSKNKNPNKIVVIILMIINICIKSHFDGMLLCSCLFVCESRLQLLQLQQVLVGQRSSLHNNNNNTESKLQHKQPQACVGQEGWVGGGALLADALLKLHCSPDFTVAQQKKGSRQQHTAARLTHRRTTAAVKQTNRLTAAAAWGVTLPDPGLKTQTCHRCRLEGGRPPPLYNVSITVMSVQICSSLHHTQTHKHVLQARKGMRVQEGG